MNIPKIGCTKILSNSSSLQQYRVECVTFQTLHLVKRWTFPNTRTSSQLLNEWTKLCCIQTNLHCHPIIKAHNQRTKQKIDVKTRVQNQKIFDFDSTVLLFSLHLNCVSFRCVRIFYTVKSYVKLHSKRTKQEFFFISQQEMCIFGSLCSCVLSSIAAEREFQTFRHVTPCWLVKRFFVHLYKCCLRLSFSSVTVVYSFFFQYVWLYLENFAPCNPSRYICVWMRKTENTRYQKHSTPMRNSWMALMMEWIL